MSRVGLSIGGFSTYGKDYFPMTYTNTPDEPNGAGTMSIWHPILFTFDEYFEQYANISSLSASAFINSVSASANVQQFGVTNLDDPSQDETPPADELAISASCNHSSGYIATGAPTSNPLSLIWKLSDTGFSGSEQFSPYFDIRWGGALFTNPALLGVIPAEVQTSAVVLTFCGKTIPMFEFIFGAPFTGYIDIVPFTYWGYDGIWDTTTGAQLISPVPTGL